MADDGQWLPLRTDSPLLGFDHSPSSPDPLHYPSPDYMRHLPLQHDVHDDDQPAFYDDAYDDDKVLPVPFPFLNSAPSPRHQPRLPSFSSTLSVEQPLPLPPAVIPELYKRASALSLRKQSSTLSLRNKSSALSLRNYSSVLSLRHQDSVFSLSPTSPSFTNSNSKSHSPNPSLTFSSSGIGTPDSVRNAVYIDSHDVRERLGALLLAASNEDPFPPPSTSTSSFSSTHSPPLHPSSSQVYIGSNPSQVYLGPQPPQPAPLHSSYSSSPDSLYHFPPPISASTSRSSDDSGPLGSTPGTSPELRPSVYIHPANPTPPRRPPRPVGDQELGYESEFDDTHFGRVYGYPYSSVDRKGLAPPTCSRWSLGSSIDIEAEVEKRRSKRGSKDSKNSAAESSGEGKRRSVGKDVGALFVKMESSMKSKEAKEKEKEKEKEKLGTRKRLASFISARFGAVEKTVNIESNPGTEKVQGGSKDKPMTGIDKEKVLPMVGAEKQLPPILLEEQEPIEHEQVYGFNFPSPPVTIPTPTPISGLLPVPTPISGVGSASAPSLLLNAHTPTAVSPIPSPSPTPTPTPVPVPTPTATLPAPARAVNAASAAVATPTLSTKKDRPVLAVDVRPVALPSRTYSGPPLAAFRESTAGRARAASTATSASLSSFTSASTPASASVSGEGELCESPVLSRYDSMRDLGVMRESMGTPTTIHAAELGGAPYRYATVSNSHADLSARAQAQQAQVQVHKKRSRRSLGIRELAVRMGLASAAPPPPVPPLPPLYTSGPENNDLPFLPPSLSRMRSFSDVRARSPSPASPPSSPASPRRKQAKRRLLISGLDEGDEGAYEAVRRWCEAFGEVREMKRRAGGCLVVDFRKASVADTVCRVQAQVYIRGAGSVNLSWSTKK